MIRRRAHDAATPRCGCRGSITPRSPPRWSSTGSSPRRASRVRASAASATSSGCGSSWTRRATSSPSSTVGWACPSTGAGCASPWTTGRPARSGRRSSGCTTTVSRIAASSSSTGARAAAPACRTWRSSRHPRAARSGRSGTTSSRDDGLARSRRGRSRSPPRGPRRSSATRPSRCIPTTSATGPLVGSAVLIPFVGPRGAHHRGRGRGARLRHRRGRRSRRRMTTTTSRPASRHGLPVDRRDDRRRPHGDRRRAPFAGLDAAEARAADPGATSRRPGDLRRDARRTRWSSAAATRSDDVVEPRIKTQWFINVKPMAERAMAAVREGGPASCRRASRRCSSTGWRDIHDWNVSRQLWWGHRIPAWYCPDGHVTVSDAERRSGPLLPAAAAPARRAAPGGRHLRHLVLERAVAVLDARLAGRDGRPGALLPGHASWRPATTSSSSGSPG